MPGCCDAGALGAQKEIKISLARYAPRVRKGEIGRLVGEMQNLVEPTERPATEGWATMVLDSE
jgi:hypothetical protein